MPDDETKLAASIILIADDNQQNRELLDAYLSEEGYGELLHPDGEWPKQPRCRLVLH